MIPGGNEMKSVGQSAGACCGPVPRAGQKGEGLLSQFIFRTVCFTSLPAASLSPIFSPSVLQTLLMRLSCVL